MQLKLLKYDILCITYKFSVVLRINSFYIKMTERWHGNVVDFSLTIMNALLSVYWHILFNLVYTCSPPHFTFQIYWNPSADDLSSHYYTFLSS